jgi:hypothetical protein
MSVPVVANKGMIADTVVLGKGMYVLRQAEERV